MHIDGLDAPLPYHRVLARGRSRNLRGESRGKGVAQAAAYERHSGGSADNTSYEIPAASGAGFSLWGLLANEFDLAATKFHRLKPAPLRPVPSVALEHMRYRGYTIWREFNFS
jgi:hypothetical protein